MENRIKLVMNDDKSIEVFVNDVSKHKIAEDHREFSAKKVYDIFNYKSGDSYIICAENPRELDKPVLAYFFDLFSNINHRIKELNKDSSEDETDK